MNESGLQEMLSYMEREMGDELYGHSERVALLSYITGKEINLETNDLQSLYFAGLFHEIGKTNLPEKIIIENKTIDINKIYPYFSKVMLDNFDNFDKVKEIILKHHENFDGSGYPKGLIGEEIGLLAMIVRISDFYDHNKKNNTHEEIIKLLNENGNVKFSKQIIKPFTKAVNNSSVCD